MSSQPPGPEQYLINEDWFSANIPVWNRLLADFDKAPRRALEIGAYEGRSAVWLIENKLKAGDEFHVCDIWDPKENVKDGLLAEERFDLNMRLAMKRVPGISFFKHKGLSGSVVRKLLETKGEGTFDLIYIDGSHMAPEVLEDLVLSFRLCKAGGLIICDDYLWNFGDNPVQTPKLAIDAFTNCFCEKVEIIRHEGLYQMYLRKRAD